MNKRTTLAALTLAALSGTVMAVTPADARAAGGDNQLSAAVGVTGQGQMTWRAGLAHDWDKRWWQGERGYLTGYWDTAYTYWEGGDEGSAAHSLSFSPILVYQFHGERLRPFVEFGIGVSLFSSTDVGDQERGPTGCRSGAARWQSPGAACDPLFQRRHQEPQRRDRKLRAVLQSSVLSGKPSSGSI